MRFPRSGMHGRVASCFFGFLSSSAFALLEVYPPAGENMILQRGLPVTLEGRANAGTPVTASCLDSKASSQADANGFWRISLPPLNEPGGPHVLTIASDEGSIKFSNILIGDIWVCSGQSNMQWPLNKAGNPEKEIAEASQPLLRLLAVPRLSSQTPLKNITSRWQVCTPEAAADFSAVGYFFGREVAKKTGIPIGLIACAWGGQPAQGFVRKELLETNVDLSFYVRQAEEKAKDHPRALKEYLENEGEILAAWKKQALEAKSRGLKPPLRPVPPPGPDAPRWPQNIWNGMIHPLTKIPITGVVWYQGESNTDKPFLYRSLLKGLIEDWRSAWKQGSFPFYIVQLANYKKRHDRPSESRWAELRESQMMALDLPDTGIAAAIDIGEANAIHPANKQEVGRRLSLLALRDFYKLDVDHAGPTFDKMETRNEQMIVHFLHSENLHTSDGGPVDGFSLAGQDRRFHWANAKIEGETVVLECPEVPNPAAVRYAWADNPKTNLYNKANLPAMPFRTDNWPSKTSPAQ